MFSWDIPVLDCKSGGWGWGLEKQRSVSLWLGLCLSVQCTCICDDCCRPPAGYCRTPNIRVNTSLHVVSFIKLPAWRYASVSWSWHCVCLSVTSWYYIKMSECIELLLCTEVTLGSSYKVFLGNSGICKNTATSLWNFVPNSGARKILPRHIDRPKCFQISLTDDAFLSRWASTFVYNTMGMTQCVAQVRLRRLKLVSFWA